MEKEHNKRIIISLIIFFLVLVFFTLLVFFKEEEKSIEYIDNLEFEFNAEVKISDIIKDLKGSLKSDYEIDTTSIGKKEIIIEYYDKRKKSKEKKCEISIVDSTKPKIIIDDIVKIPQGSKIDLTETIPSGDDCDPNPKRRILGDYNIDELGDYHLIFEVEDFSGNVESKEFTLRIAKNETNQELVNTETKKFSEVINNYKKDNTQVGIDVSLWQGNIDWKRVKNAGCNFAFIRVGYQEDFGGKNVEDKYFKKNIEEAQREGIKVGLYFYSYAINEEESKQQAEWVLSKIEKNNIELPIAFDWESWNSFVKCKLSFFQLNNIANTFISEIEKGGFKASLYSSKNFLEKIWYKDKYENIWLAHYADETDYEGKYQYWQMSNTGSINGINGNVDINIFRDENGS